MQNYTNYSAPGAYVKPRLNPLAKYMRRPKMMLRLPSQGKYWPDGALDRKEDNSYEVYAMTIKDEIMAKTPDALLTGISMAHIIESCIPSIKDDMAMPGIDLDAVLIAIRIATYGEKTTVNFTVPGKDEPIDFDIDLRPVLDNICDNTYWDEKLVINDDMTAYIKPINYALISKYALSTMEATKLLTEIATNVTLDDATRMKYQAEAVEKLTNATLDQVVSSIMRIDSTEGSVEDTNFIAEYLNNCEKEVFNKISVKFDSLNEENNRRKLTIATPQDLIDQGMPETVQVDFNFDLSSFFA